MKTAELTGPALDWAVARCESLGTDKLRIGAGQVFIKDCDTLIPCAFSTDWQQGGPIIEREKFAIAYAGGGWQAANSDYLPRFYEGQTPLIAAMRCYVTSKLGDEIDIPEELCA